LLCTAATECAIRLRRSDQAAATPNAQSTRRRHPASRTPPRQRRPPAAAGVRTLRVVGTADNPPQSFASLQQDGQSTRRPPGPTAYCASTAGTADVKVLVQQAAASEDRISAHYQRDCRRKKTPGSSCISSTRSRPFRHSLVVSVVEVDHLDSARVLGVIATVTASLRRCFSRFSNSSPPSSGDWLEGN
jgi:hypothetical protein